jgi:vancomycin resistance protein VanJ
MWGGRMKHKLSGLAAGTSNAYTVLLLGFLLLHRTPAGSWWWVRLVGDFLPHLFVPLLVLAPLVLVSRSRAAKLMIGVPCVAFALLYGELFFPSLGAGSSQQERTLKVLTYNVTMGEPGVDEILSIIESENPDVVALQEVSLEVEQAVARLAVDYPYQALHPVPGGSVGSGVLSRLPILEDEAFALVQGTHLFQHAVLDMGGSRVHFLNIHLLPPWLPGRWWGGHRFYVPAGYDTTVQGQELQQVLAMVDGLEGPIVVAGDFNMTDQSAGYRALTQRLGDAYREVGWGLGFTFPDQEARHFLTRYPLLRIDYVFHSRDMTAHRAYVGETGGPNHRYLVAVLSF